MQKGNKKDLLLKETLMKFFNKKKLQIVADVLDKKTKYSLRIVEWFISNYAKKHNVTYKVGNKIFNVYSSYKNGQLKSFSKKQFDLFRRSDRFTIRLDESRSFETTVGQLNFFRWAIENNVLNYVDKHIQDIKKDMEVSITRDKDKVKNKKTKKIIKTSQNIVITRNSITIHFD